MGYIRLDEQPGEALPLHAPKESGQHPAGWPNQAYGR